MEKMHPSDIEDPGAILEPVVGIAVEIAASIETSPIITEIGTLFLLCMTTTGAIAASRRAI